MPNPTGPTFTISANRENLSKQAGSQAFKRIKGHFWQFAFSHIFPHLRLQNEKKLTVI